MRRREFIMVGGAVSQTFSCLTPLFHQSTYANKCRENPIKGWRFATLGGRCVRDAPAIRSDVIATNKAGAAVHEG
jgi:hypothetical protein